MALLSSASWFIDLEDRGSASLQHKRQKCLLFSLVLTGGLGFIKSVFLSCATCVCRGKLILILSLKGNLQTGTWETGSKRDGPFCCCLPLLNNKQQTIALSLPGENEQHRVV